jgi:hypothetical protein
MYLLLTEWKTWEQNTFFLEFDDEECPIFNYPSTVADKELIDCLIRRFDCLHIAIKPILKQWGIYPLGQKPDGIDYVLLDQAEDCDDNIWTI